MTDSDQILVADDDETFVLSTVDLLRREGYTCDCASDAMTATEMIGSTNYDLLIADIKMPGNRELEFIKELSHIAKGMPIILITGYPSLDSAIRSIQLPVAAYLVKPVDFDKLLNHIQASIERFRVHRTLRNMQQRLKDWHKDLATIGEALTADAWHTSTMPVDTFLDLTFQNVVGALSDMKYLTEAFTGNNVEQEPCHLLNCPRLGALVDAVMETIRVLEKTKSAFKSRELGELRQKLEELIRSGTT